MILQRYILVILVTHKFGVNVEFNPHPQPHTHAELLLPIMLKVDHCSSVVI